MTNYAGTIRKSETEDVLSATLARRKVNPAKWSFKCGELHLLVGSRIVKFPAKAGNTYWGLEAIRQQLETAIDEMEDAAKHRGQLDLEDAIKAAPVPA